MDSGLLQGGPIWVKRPTAPIPTQTQGSISSFGRLSTSFGQPLLPSGLLLPGLLLSGPGVHPLGTPLSMSKEIKPWQEAVLVLMELRFSASWRDQTEKHDLLFFLMTQEAFRHIHSPSPSSPRVTYMHMQNKSAKSDIMTRRRISTPLEAVPRDSSIFIMANGHEGLSTNPRSWSALATMFPHSSIYIGVCWKTTYVAESSTQGQIIQKLEPWLAQAQ